MSRFAEYRNSFEQRVRQSLRWSPEELEPGVDPETRQKANKVYRIVVLSQVALGVIYFSMLLAAVVYHFGGDAVGMLAFAASPVWVVILIYAILVLGVARAVFGTVAVMNSSRCGSMVSFVLSAIVVIMSFIVLIFGILRAGGTGVIAPEVSQTQFADEVLTNMVQYALADLNRWAGVQDNALQSRCCGINLKAYYTPSLFGVEPFNVTEFNNGAICNTAGNNAIETLILLFPTYGSEVQEDADVSAPLQGYFCEDQLITALRNLAISTIPALTLPILLEIVAVFFLTRLLYRYSVAEGGMKLKHNKVGAPKPILEDTILKKAGYKQQQPLRF